MTFQSKLPDYISEVLAVQTRCLNSYVHHGDIVLNIGSGSGGGMNCIKHKAKLVIHLDIDIESLKKIPRDETNYAVCADIYHLPIKQAVIDMVICDWIIEHLEKPQFGLWEINKAVKGSGIIQILTPNVVSLFGLISAASPYKVKRFFRRHAFSKEFETPHRTFYRFNNYWRISRMFRRLGYEQLNFDALPGLFVYFKQKDILYILSVWAEKLFDLCLPMNLRTYLYFVFQKK